MIDYLKITLFWFLWFTVAMRMLADQASGYPAGIGYVVVMAVLGLVAILEPTLRRRGGL